MKTKNIKTIVLPVVLAFMLAGCSGTQLDNGTSTTTETAAVETVAESTDAAADETSDGQSTVSTTEDSSQDTTTTILSGVEGSMLDTTAIFSDRDLEQTPDLTAATTLQLTSNEDMTIDQEGVYVLSGTAENVTVTVEADDQAKVQIVLDGVNVTNVDAPVIYVKTADKVFVTSTGTDNYMEVSGTYAVDGETNPDAVIFSKADLVLNGTGTLEIVSAQGNGVSAKDDLKVTGGGYVITASADGLEANDSISIYDGNLTINTQKDALHSENDEDDTLGYIYILNGTLNITAADDAIRGTSIVQIDGGDINIETCTEGIEGTYIQLNGGNIDMHAANDGINATNKSTAYDVMIEVNGGTIHVIMGAGDTDAFDANGNITINDGTIDIEATSAFDSDGTAQLNGGQVTVNGETITQITQTQMGGGRGGKRR